MNHLPRPLMPSDCNQQKAQQPKVLVPVAALNAAISALESCTEELRKKHLCKDTAIVVDAEHLDAFSAITHAMIMVEHLKKPLETLGKNTGTSA